MSDERYSFEEILFDLELLRDHERELIENLTALIESGSAPDRIAGVLKLARDAFGADAARFLIDPHWKLNHEPPILVARTLEGAQEVELLLGRIIHGICV